MNALDAYPGEEEVGVLKTSSVSDDSFNPHESKTVVKDERGLVQCPVEAGTIIVSRMNTPERVGSCGLVVKAQSNLYLPDRLWKLKLKSGTDSRFLHVLLTSNIYKSRIVRMATGTSGSMHNIPKDSFLDMRIVLPDIAEQTRIGEFFRALDDLIAAAKKKADLLKLKKKYYLQAIFSQRLRFKGFTKPWQQRKLEELCIRVGSGGTPSVQHPEYYNGKIPFLGISDLSGRAVSATQKKITQRGLDNSAAWLVPKGSITLAMYASVGKVTILDIELATSQAFFNMVIPEETCIRDFLFSRLEKADICHEWLPLISTGTQPNLNAAKLKDWELKVPSTQERKTIGEFFHALDDLAAALARKIELLERRKTAYLQRLFV